MRFWPDVNFQNIGIATPTPVQVHAVNQCAAPTTVLSESFYQIDVKSPSDSHDITRIKF